MTCFRIQDLFSGMSFRLPAVLQNRYPYPFLGIRFRESVFVLAPRTPWLISGSSIKDGHGPPQILLMKSQDIA